MTTFLLSVHVLVAIIAIGPVTVAASMYAPAVRAALRDPGDVRTAGVVGTLHRICNVYAAIGITVPIFGFATAASMDVLGDPWLVTSIILTGLAAVLLATVVLPWQRQLLEEIAPGGATGPAGAGHANPAAVAARTKRLAMTTGMFSLLWAVVTVLMIARPGSTTGV
ncbi:MULTISPECIES: hypothetical protein [unclassified Parafrankia]|uniref:hypothetical protein n=1 Tax=unclassified Parafrankia TaxID=2994368 RepID=UPI000DA50FD5|nr:MULTISPECIES: hypothetical protein [unclassified Parafrankia]TCJ35913.1 hypothetical protein E0504_25420 [Parafrankia sp. BMG5.11]SQD94729.1 putative integral membrane protein; protease domain [Parafrankia sp. Ea1.12]